MDQLAVSPAPNIQLRSGGLDVPALLIQCLAAFTPPKGCPATKAVIEQFIGSKRSAKWAARS
jgi:hypothetical protein